MEKIFFKLTFIIICAIAPYCTFSQNNYQAHIGNVMNICFSHDGKFIASCAEDHTVKIWDVYSGTLLKTLADHSEQVNAVCFSPDDKLLISGGYDDKINVYNVQTWSIKWTIPIKDVVNFLCFSNDGKFFAAAGTGGELGLGEIGKGIRIYNTLNGVLYKSLQEYHYTRQVSFSPDDKYLTSCIDDETIKFWDVESGNIIKTIETSEEDIFSITYSNNNKLIISGGKAKLLKIWDNNTGNLLDTLSGHLSTIKAVCISQNSKFIVSGDAGGTINIWDTRTLKVIKTINDKQHGITCVQVSPDNNYIASSNGWGGTIKIWNVQDILSSNNSVVYPRFLVDKNLPVNNVQTRDPYYSQTQLSENEILIGAFVIGAILIGKGIEYIRDLPSTQSSNYSSGSSSAGSANNFTFELVEWNDKDNYAKYKVLKDGNWYNYKTEKVKWTYGEYCDNCYGISVGGYGVGHYDVDKHKVYHLLSFFSSDGAASSLEGAVLFFLKDEYENR